MFNISSLPRHTVTVPFVIERDGVKEEHPFTATFEMIDPESEGIDPTVDKGDRELLDRVLVGLGDIMDEKGKELPFSDELKSQVIGRIDVRAALLRAFYAEIPKLIRGN